MPSMVKYRIKLVAEEDEEKGSVEYDHLGDALNYMKQFEWDKSEDIKRLRLEIIATR